MGDVSKGKKLMSVDQDPAASDDIRYNSDVLLMSL